MSVQEQMHVRNTRRHAPNPAIAKGNRDQSKWTTPLGDPLRGERIPVSARNPRGRARIRPTVQVHGRDRLGLTRKAVFSAGPRLPMPARNVPALRAAQRLFALARLRPLTTLALFPTAPLRN